MKIHYLQSTLRYSDSQPLSFCTLTYVCVPLSSPFFCSDTQPHLHEIVNRSMSLANTAQEPCNYFLLLRALFRSIGGGQKRNTTISLRPRDHSLSCSHAGKLVFSFFPPGSHEQLYQEFLPLLSNLLQGM